MVCCISAGWISCVNAIVFLSRPQSCQKARNGGRFILLSGFLSLLQVLTPKGITRHLNNRATMTIPNLLVDDQTPLRSQI